jgi:hypothetical protein
MNPIKLNKRHIILASIIVSIGVALSINYWIFPLKQSKNKMIESSSEGSTNIEKKSKIKSDQEIEKIKSFFKNEKDEQEKFQHQILEVSSSDQDYTKKIIQDIRQENNIESLIKSKFDDNLIDCMVRIGKNGCNVIVSFKTDLTKENVYKIKNIIKDQTDFKNNEITITEKSIND